MLIPHAAVIAVADGEKLRLFRNAGTDAAPKLEPMPEVSPSGDNKGAGVRHSTSAANPNDSQLEEDSFAAATAAWLNHEAQAGRIKDLVVVAAPRTLGELRKHYHKTVSEALRHELAKDLTGHSTTDIQAALVSA